MDRRRQRVEDDDIVTDSRSRSAVCDPMKPAPPVMSTFIVVAAASWRPHDRRPTSRSGCTQENCHARRSPSDRSVSDREPVASRMAWPIDSGSLGSARSRPTGSFRHCRRIRCDDWTGAGHRLEDRQAESLVEGGVDQEIGRLVKASGLLKGDSDRRTRRPERCRARAASECNSAP